MMTKCNSSGYRVGGGIHNDGVKSNRIDSGLFIKVPPELFHHIPKFFSFKDLVACSMVCRFLSFAASDKSLWRTCIACDEVFYNQRVSIVIVLGRSFTFSSG